MAQTVAKDAFNCAAVEIEANCGIWVDYADLRDVVYDVFRLLRALREAGE